MDTASLTQQNLKVLKAKRKYENNSQTAKKKALQISYAKKVDITYPFMLEKKDFILFRNALPRGKLNSRKKSFYLF